MSFLPVVFNSIELFPTGNFGIFSYTINQYDFFTIIWNFLLALIPIFLASFMIRLLYRLDINKYLRYLILVFLFLVWLVFIPNTAYIMTVVRHLADYCPYKTIHRNCRENVWMIMFFFSYAVFGWILFVYGINQMKKFFAYWKKPFLNLFYITVSIPFISLGLLIGLIDRANSWEIFSEPYKIIVMIWRYFYDPVYLKNWLLFTIFLYFLYFFGDSLFSRKFIDK
jgi:uncharacterized membrane protein